MPKKKSPPLFRPSTVVPILVVTFVLIYVIYSDNSSKNTPPDRTVTRVNSTGSVTPVSTPKPVTPPVTPTDREVS